MMKHASLRYWYDHDPSHDHVFHLPYAAILLEQLPLPLQTPIVLEYGLRSKAAKINSSVTAGLVWVVSPKPSKRPFGTDS